MTEKHNLFNWDVDVNLLKTPFILFMVWKILILVSLIIPVLLFVLDLFEGNISSSSLGIYLKIYLLIASIFTVLTIISYYVVFIPIAGVKYGLKFEMDDKGINHIVRECSRKKCYLLAFFGMTVGMLAKEPGITGANLIAYSRQNMYTPFKKVKKIIYNRKNGIIKLICSDLTRNAIFTYKDNSETIFKYICEHCQKAKVKIKKV